MYAIGNTTGAGVLVHNIFQLNMNAPFVQLERLQIVWNLRITKNFTSGLVVLMIVVVKVAILIVVDFALP